ETWASRMTPSGLATFEHLPLNEVARQQLLANASGFRVGGASTKLVVDEVRRMQARGIRVVLAEAPLPERSIPLHPHGAGDVAAFQQELRKIATETGAEMLSLPQELRANELYQDYSHLNQEGAARYSSLLATALK